MLLRPEGIGVLDDESVFIKLSWVDGCQAGELLARSVDDVKVTIGTVVPSQSDIGAGSLCVGSINLKNCRKRKEPGESIVSLQSAEDKRSVAVGQGQVKSVPLRPSTEGQSFVCTIGGAHAEFVQSSVVVTPEALEKPHRQPAILRRAVGELVPGPVVNAHWNIDVFVNVEGRDEPLGKHVNDVVVGVGAVVKIRPKSGLPFLCLSKAVRIRSVEDETLELQFPETRKFWPSLESGVSKIADAVGTLKKADLRVEVGADLSVFRFKVEPVGTEVQSGTEIGLPAGETRRAGLCGVTVHNKVFEENKSAIRA